MDTRSAIQEASASHVRGDLAAAERAYAEVLAIEPSNADALFLSGTLHAQRGEWNLSEARLRKLLSAHSGHADGWMNLAHVLEQQGKTMDAIPCYKHYLCLRPEAAQTWFDLGLIAFRARSFEDAEQAYRRYIQLVPDSIEGHFNLGATLHDAHKLDAAQREYERVLQLDPQQVEAHRGLGNIALHQRRYMQAVEHFRRTLAIAPQDVEALSNLGVMLQKTGQLREAEQVLRQAVRAVPDHVNAHFNLGLVLLLQGKFHEGWQEYEWRHRIKSRVPVTFSQPEWNGSPLQGETVLLRAEQGFGDTFQFVRYAPLIKARGGRVAVECQAGLKRILLRTPGIELISEHTASGQPLVEFDVHVPMLGLPRLFDSDRISIPADVPYIHPESWAVDRWSKRLANDRGLRVGVVWAGRPTHEDDRNRSCSLEQFLSLTDIPGVTLYSIQKGPAVQELARPEIAGRIVDLDAEIDDFADTAAAIANLDLVVCVDTSVAHLAGAMNKPTWVVLPFAPDWRWLAEGEGNPWYPSLRIFRQQETGDWSGLFSQLRAALVERAARHAGHAELAGGYDVDVIEQLRQARLALRSQSWDQAANWCQSVLENQPQHAEANFLFGFALFSLGQAAEALTMLASAYESWPQHPLLLKILGMALQTLGQFPEAEQCYLGALQYGNDDPEILFNLGVLKHQDGHVEAARDLYQTALALRPAFPDCLNNFGLALGSLGLMEASVARFREAITLRPDFFDAILNLANIQYVQGEVAAAVELFERAVRLRPDHARARNGLGVALKRLNRMEEAITEFRQAVALDPSLAEAHNNLGNAFKLVGRLSEAVEAYRCALALNPGSALSWTNLGSALQAQGELKEAIEALDHAVELDPQLPEAHWNRALAWLAVGDYRRGWPEYEWGLAAGARPIPPRTFPVWDGVHLPGKTLLVSTEQGFGDAIQFIRFLPLARQRVGRVLLECPPELLRLFAGAGGIDAVVECGTPDKALPDVSARISLMSLPAVLGTADDLQGAAPYLSVDAGRGDEFALRISDERLKLGLVWAGSAAHQDDRNRSCSLAALSPLFALKDVVWYSLVPGASDALREAGVPVRDITPWLHDFSDTAAAIARLDLVITVDTAVAHLAGAMGKPVWILLPFAADWRWGRGGEKTPWYPSARLFRQEAPGDWRVLVEDVADSLHRLLQQH